jgi:hypothetical protein
MRAMLLSLTISIGCSASHAPATPDSPGPTIDSAATTDAPVVGQTSTLSIETAPNTSASSLFADDYKNYNTTAQTGNGNGDMVPRAISKLSIASAAQHVYVESQTWFCHLASNEGTDRLISDARCASHIDIGYNADDAGHAAAAVADMKSRGLEGVIMDWSGKDAAHDGDATYYPTGTSTETKTKRGSTEVGTNAIYAYRTAAEAAGSFNFAVSEDEGITNCRNGSCACWPAYGSACDETSEVISDLSYIDAHWATSPAYLRVGGKPVVTFFAPDYNACPCSDPVKGECVEKKTPCKTIDWDTVQHFVSDQDWVFENKTGYAHKYSAGAFDWVSTSKYPGTDSTNGVSSVADYDAFVKKTGNVGASQHVFAGAFKGFDDGVTDAWNYGDGSHTRFIDQKCGATWLKTLAQVASDFPAGAEFLQLPTWDDYEEATELETGIDTCVSAFTGEVTGTQLGWTVDYGKDLTGSASGSDATIDHFVVWASPDGEQLVRIAPDVVRDATGTLPHSLDLGAYPLPAGTTKVFVQAIGKPFLANAMSSAIAAP